MSAVDPNGVAAPAHSSGGAPATSGAGAPLNGELAVLVGRFATRIDQLQRELASLRATIESHGDTSTAASAS